MWTPDYFIRFVELPPSVEGVTIPNDDGTFDIYINAILPEGKREDCVQHEIRHIMQDHFYISSPVAVCEAEANGEEVPKRLPNIFEEKPPNTIPIFASLEAFGHYMFAMREQYQRELKK